MKRNTAMFLQDFIAPFYIFIRFRYSLSYKFIDYNLYSGRAILKSVSEKHFLKRGISRTFFKTYINSGGIEKLIIKDGRKITEVTWSKE